MTIERSRENIHFNVLRNALYHTARRMTLDRWNRWCSFLVIVLGAAAMADALKIYGVDIQRGWVGAAVAVVGAAQLVFDFGGRARDHQTLQREYYHLLSNIEAEAQPSEERVAGWYSQMIRIAGDEPPMMRALDAKAYNDAIDASGYYDRSQRLIIPVTHKLLGQFLSFEGVPYDTVAEVEERKKIAA
ncbi:hypothetical protein [Rhizobium leguminosarum]|nr:hypothetical protein [Rhizobium leguminosarum]